MYFSRIPITICCLLTMTTARSHAADPSPVTAWRQAHEAEILRDFAELLALPNVASDAENIRRNAEFIRGQLERRGARTEPRATCTRATTATGPPTRPTGWRGCWRR